MPKMKVVTVIMKFEHTADEQQQSAISFTCLFVLMSGCIIMEKSLLTAVSQPKEKQTKESTIYPSIRKVPIVQVVVT